MAASFLPSMPFHNLDKIDAIGGAEFHAADNTGAEESKVAAWADSRSGIFKVEVLRFLVLYDNDDE